MYGQAYYNRKRDVAKLSLTHQIALFHQISGRQKLQHHETATLKNNKNHMDKTQS